MRVCVCAQIEELTRTDQKIVQQIVEQSPGPNPGHIPRPGQKPCPCQKWYGLNYLITKLIINIHIW